MRTDSSQDCLAHTLARLPDPRKATSDLISPILARYDLKKKTKNFCMTVEQSYGREGGGFQMTVEPSCGRERVKEWWLVSSIKVSTGCCICSEQAYCAASLDKNI